MMIVLLVMTIILAAFAPLMTRRMKSNMSTGGSGGESLWAELATNGPGIYYGTGNAESVIIGAANKAADDNARLILKKGTAAQNHMLFKNESGTSFGGLRIDNTSMYLGTPPVSYTYALYNNSFGMNALKNIEVGGIYNTAMGYNAGEKNTTGRDNTFIGSMAGSHNTTGEGNTNIGSNAGSSISASYTTTIGYKAGYLAYGGSNNTFTGNEAGYFSSGSKNTFIGNMAGVESDSDNNTFIGNEAGAENKSGSHNIFIGNMAGKSNRGSSGGSMNGGASYNTFVGDEAGKGNSGTFNTIIGSQSGDMPHLGFGNYNTALGYKACKNIWTPIASNKTCIGANSGPLYNELGLGNDINQIWIGSRVGGNGIGATDEIFLDSGMTHIRGQVDIASLLHVAGATRIMDSLDVHGTFTNPSDKRLKNIKGENTSGLEKIKQIKVFNYTMKDDKEKTPRVGVIAQDLQKIFPDAVSKGYEGFLAVRTEDILYALVNAVKELDKDIKEMLNQIQHEMTALKAENKQLKAQNKALEARLSRLEAKISK
jgi:FtsZ-binding cell division protein ZapB